VPGERRRGRDRRPELSQHFLRRGAVASQLVAEAPVGRDDHVVEIGPGTGALTAELARRCRSLSLVELDPRLCDRLRRTWADAARVDVVCADFLEWPLPEHPYKVVANLPFRRSAEIVRRLAGAVRPPDDAWLIVQREAALRFAGSPYGPDTLVSLLLKPWWQVEVARSLRRSDFEPPPAVDCAVLWLARRARPLVEAPERALYGDFVAAAFGRRGETLRDGLRGLLTSRQLARLARELGFDPDARPSALDFPRWLALFRFFARGAGRRVQGRVRGALEHLPRQSRASSRGDRRPM